MFRISLLTIAVAVATLNLLSGCGKSSQRATGSVSGHVTLSGKPFTNGMVKLFSVDLGNGALVQIDEEGAYEIDDSLFVGDYDVTITPIVPVPGQPIKAGAAIPVKFQNEKSSGITLSVKPGRNKLDVNM